MQREIRHDSYYQKVEELLKNFHTIKTDLASRMEYLSREYADIPAAVTLRGYASDMEVIPGNKDPETKIMNDIRHIQAEERYCNMEIRIVVAQIADITRLEKMVREMSDKSGVVLRGLYIEQPPMTWDSLQDELKCSRTNVQHHREKGIQRLATKMYSKIQNS